MDPRDLVGQTFASGQEVTRRSAERLESLVGQLQRLTEEQLDQVSAFVGALRDRSLQTGEQVVGFVDRQVRSQLGALGIATSADLERVEAKVDRLGKAKGKSKGKGAKGSGGKKSGGSAKVKRKDRASESDAGVTGVTTLRG